MKMQQLNDTNYLFKSSVNVGYVHEGSQGLLIDAGIDKSAIRKVVRQLEDKDLPITHLIITHAHSDHYGGASYLKQQYDVKVIAPRFESAILQYPILEPTYLFGGNDPIDELRNKFLEGPPVEVDILVDEGPTNIDPFSLEFIETPGHSYQQMAVAINNTLYAADSYFGQDELLKHKIPYITSVEKTIHSLYKLKNLTYSGAVPGHGKYEENYQETINKNIEYHENLLHNVYYTIEKANMISHEEIVARLCQDMNVKVDQLSIFLLFRTAVTAYLTALINQEKIEHYIQHYRWMFKIKGEKGD
ncbi:MBL fold metallo-hydrolase [Tenuibacillus multivorans]|uniref:Glyoxylase, beta-lactamase superfamily II n=1 Tax=Tenuibacillus multivorans TaxID=237069 RepID=A0A1H0EJD1_9BACI|nr:MBL fold metallo-hydrolase [Tenuibacillus multivorans]GEL77134.1 MBL fold metallo-hydrolase [Tenuibacillus multivorans]SDN82452.1 Glyoxylase, beta-lactamase superfamily II [Tenuibacillus multivorans]